MSTRYAVAPMNFHSADDFIPARTLESARKKAMRGSKQVFGDMWGVWDNRADKEGGHFIEFVYCGERFVPASH